MLCQAAPWHVAPWFGPIWIIANCIVFRRLLNHDFIEQARALREKTARLLGDDLQKTGTLYEFYNPFTGETILNPDFLNWNLFAVVMADEKFGSVSVDS
jgi:putative isomerase